VVRVTRIVRAARGLPAGGANQLGIGKVDAPVIVGIANRG